MRNWKFMMHAMVDVLNSDQIHVPLLLHTADNRANACFTMCAGNAQPILSVSARSRLLHGPFPISDKALKFVLN